MFHLKLRNRQSPTGVLLQTGSSAKQRILTCLHAMHLKGKVYYYVTTDKPRKWRKLDSDLAIAKRMWPEIEGVGYVNSLDYTFHGVALRYRKLVVAAKAPQTQKDNEKELQRLEGKLCFA